MKFNKQSVNNHKTKSKPYLTEMNPIKRKKKTSDKDTTGFCCPTLFLFLFDIK